MNAPQAQMPRWKCHKEVYAIKCEVAEGGVLRPLEAGYADFTPPEGFFEKHKPLGTGYYVVYSPDEYASWSPVEPFESGYTRI